MSCWLVFALASIRAIMAAVWLDLSLEEDDLLPLISSCTATTSSSLGVIVLFFKKAMRVMKE